MSEPITVAELDEMEPDLRAEAERGPGHPYVRAETALRLVDEIRRMWSNEWLQSAAREVENEMSDAEIVAIFREHRDVRP